jgi:hypothetical protein
MDDVDSLLVEPDVEFTWFEADEAAHFDEWDPPLRHEPTDMARCDAENLGDLIRVQQRSTVPWYRGCLRGCRIHALSSPEISPPNYIEPLSDPISDNIQVRGMSSSGCRRTERFDSHVETKQSRKWTKKGPDQWSDAA